MSLLKFWQGQNSFVACSMNTLLSADSEENAFSQHLVLFFSASSHTDIILFTSGVFSREGNVRLTGGLSALQQNGL